LLNYHYNENDAIQGERIVIEARKITQPIHFSDRTSRHGGQRAKANDARAWIERAYVLGKKGL
jgi:hypothetical protein